jgi:hypothetical protein
MSKMKAWSARMKGMPELFEVFSRYPIYTWGVLKVAKVYLR